MDACCGFLREKKKLKWHDQDLLNALCFPDIFYLDERWNKTPLRIMRRESKQIAEITKTDVEDAYIFHYATNKPWERSLMELNFPEALPNRIEQGIATICVTSRAMIMPVVSRPKLVP